MFDEIPFLDKKGLRDFGLVTGALFAGIFGIAFPYAFEYSWPIWPWVILILLALFALLKPLWLRPFYNVWMRISMAIGAVVSRIILAAVFFLVVTPTGLIMRACGTDPMRRKLDNEAPSYKETISENKSNSFDKPY
jgi:hypothetical protein